MPAEGDTHRGFTRLPLCLPEMKGVRLDVDRVDMVLREAHQRVLHVRFLRSARHGLAASLGSEKLSKCCYVYARYNGRLSTKRKGVESLFKTFKN
jgi:hypothetical protein